MKKFLRIFIAVIIGCAVVSYLSTRDVFRRGAVYRSVKSVLETIALAQESYQNQELIDQDKDGIGEFGLLNELTKTDTPRDESQHMKYPHLLNQVFKVFKGETYATYAGYHYQVFLPNYNTILTDNMLSVPSNKKQAINQQEKRWIVYAWPSEAKEGIYIFAIDQKQNVYFASNKKANGKLKYIGSQAPKYNAAMPKQTTNKKEQLLYWNTLKTGDGVDGQKWSLYK